MRQELHSFYIFPTASLRFFMAALLFFMLVGRPLRANLPYECPVCNGSDECDCNEDGSDDDTSIDGEDGSPRRKQTVSSSSEGAGFGSLKFTLPFG